MATCNITNEYQTEFSKYSKYIKISSGLKFRKQMFTCDEITRLHGGMWEKELFQQKVNFFYKTC